MKGATKTKPSRRAEGDGRLELYDQYGELLHVAPRVVTESLRYLVVRTRTSEGGELPQRIGVTSAISGEGVSFVARSLALVLAHDAGKRVCLLDLNWWSEETWPGGDPNLAGIADVIRGAVPLRDALIETDHPMLEILPRGATRSSERPVLANHDLLPRILDVLTAEFEHVVVDLPAIHATSESLTLANACENIGLVVAHGVTPISQVREAVEELDGTNLLGVVINRASTKVPGFIRRRLPGA
jgi:Mrp family chromosome partitioning ATPase